MTPVERAAVVVDLLARGGEVTPRRVAELTDCKPDSARRLLNKLSRVLPLAECGGTFVHINPIAIDD